MLPREAIRTKLTWEFLILNSHEKQHFCNDSLTMLYLVSCYSTALTLLPYIWGDAMSIRSHAHRPWTMRPLKSASLGRCVLLDDAFLTTICPLEYVFLIDVSQPRNADRCRILERTILLRVLGTIFRVLRLEVYVIKLCIIVDISHQFQTTSPPPLGEKLNSFVELTVKHEESS
jgi:hypothetical protein